MTDSDRLVLKVPEAGAKLGLGRNASYAAAKRGDMPRLLIAASFVVLSKRTWRLARSRRKLRCVAS